MRLNIVDVIVGYCVIVGVVKGAIVANKRYWLKIPDQNIITPATWEILFVQSSRISWTLIYIRMDNLLTYYC